jgi:RNA polymerase sigma factor (TIGR02999 family)
MQDNDGDQVNALLAEVSAGNAQAVSQLLPLVYDQLKQLARKQMSNERDDHTLQPTALVHEAYIRMIGSDKVAWECHAHFFFAAAQSMRRILIEHARARGQLKRGGGRKRLPANMMDLTAVEQSSEILALDEALCRLESISPGVGEVVRLRFFAGLSIEETAAVLKVSPRTVKRDWTYARAWLNRELRADR